MTASLFRSMTPDRDSRKEGLGVTIWPGRERDCQGFLTIERLSEAVECPSCGTLYYAGDWPWCTGDPAQHRRD